MMEKLKKILLALIMPPLPVVLVTVPCAIVLLVYSFTSLNNYDILSIVSYVVSAYALTILCFRIPDIIHLVNAIKNNKYVLRLRQDTRLRLNITLFASVIYNLAYAVFQLGLGITHNTFWFTSFAVYYFLLAFMRFFMLTHIRKYAPGEKPKVEIGKYMFCGVGLLVMNLALAVIIMFMVVFDRTFVHHEITTIAMAAYTFTSLTIAIISVVRYKKYNSPVYSSSRVISLTSAMVSLITLEAAMLTAFGADNGPVFRRLMLGLSGGGVVLIVMSLAIYMIYKSIKQLGSLAGHKDNTEEVTDGRG